MRLVRNVGAVALVLALAAPALAQDPMEHQADMQVYAMAPDAQRVLPFFRGAEKKTDYQTILEAGKCYWFSGVGGPGVKKLALYLWGPDNKRVADHKSPNPMSTMAHCAMVSGMFKFQAKIDGAGPYVVGVYAKGGPPPGAVPPPPQAPPPPPPKPAVDLGKLCDEQAAAAAPGAKRVGEYLSTAGGRMDKMDWPVALEAGKCYWFVGAGEPGKVKELSLFLWGPDSKRVTESKSSSNASLVGHCASFPGMFKLQAKIASGGGALKVGVYSK
jgi:hypothetical protein